MAPFISMKKSLCVVVMLSMAHVSAQLVEGKKNLRVRAPRSSANIATTSVVVVVNDQHDIRKSYGCENSPLFEFEGHATKTCDTYVAKKPVKRCEKEQPGTGKKVKFFCPATCRKECKNKSRSPLLPAAVERGPCENSDSFHFAGNSSRTCDSYIAKNPYKKCRKEQPGTGKKVTLFCPATCKHKCKNTNPPTSSPIDTPTSSPTHSPTTSPTDSPTNSPSASPSAIASAQYSTPQISSDAMQAPSELADRRSPSASPPSASSLSSVSPTATTSTSQSATSSASQSNSITLVD